jgi:SAM-dependent methyltransferase
VFVGDLAKQDCAKVIGINEPSFDVTTVLFVLSAVPPEMWKPFLDNVVSAMRPGSLLLFRDYARYDMAEFRFKASSKLDQHLFLRQDLTLSFFFSREQVIELMEASGLVVEEALYFKKAETNRKTMKTRYRIFVNATFRKP